MHIKQVIIRGFKTYKEQVSLAEDFHPSVNVVVGFNGSGKSNFFNAILFVISDHFGNLRQEVRKSLLHEGAGPAVLTAFVEIVFDNTDRRMPIDKDDIKVRRTIGVKKDDYSLDGKHATKAEVFSLLESCGFTRSNPYYIVQQGKIAELTLMNDRRRLELMKEISGASVYEERKVESLKILDDIKARRSKTDEIVEAIATRIKNLESEQRELVEYQKLERQRKCIEYELTDRDWRTAQDRVDALEVKRRDVGAELNEVQREATSLRGRVNDADAEVQQIAGQLQNLAAEREQAERVQVARLEELTRVRLELDDESRRAEEIAKARRDAEEQVKRIKAEMEQVEKELKDQQPQLAAEVARKRDLQQKRQVAEAQRDQLLAKQGRRSQYTSIEQRNKALREDITFRNQRKEQGTKALKECEAEIKKAEATAKEAAQLAQARRSDLKRLEEDLARKFAPGLARVSEKLEQTSEQRRLLTQERDRLSREREEAERLASQCQNRIDGTMSRSNRNAVYEVRRWLGKQGLQNSVYGTLLENIEVPQTYAIAAESTAGNSLFNLLVQDDEVAGQIITFVRKGSLGSIVCTPMNQVQYRPRQYPRIQGVKPLVEVVTCADWCKPAVHQVFGRTVVCSSLELCDEISRKYGLDAITLDGDKVSSRGTLTGGYLDPTRFQRLALAERMRATRATVERLRPELARVEAQAEQATRELETLHEERRNLQDGRGSCRGEMATAAEVAQEAERQAARQEDAAQRQKERRDEIQGRISELDAAIAALQSEMRTKSLSDLTREEESRLQGLLDSLKDLDAGLETSEELCHQLQRTLQAREQHLQDFLKKRLNELESDLLRDPEVDRQERQQELSRTVVRLEREQVETDKAVQGKKAEFAGAEKALEEKRHHRERLTASDQQAQARITDITGKLDEIVGQINSLVKKKSDADEKLRGLTVVSSEMVAFKGMSQGQLVKELGKINKELGKFEHVNKKAIDQFQTFTEQLQDLERKRTEIDDSRAEIEGFMTQVDEQKEQTLMKTLEQVNEHFQEIFSELVRGGVGKLRMVGPEDVPDEDVEGVGQTKGVRVEVSFTGQSTSFLNMSQLSGGQKTVVAISLIFSIQRLEPAPFYLFDEIDAALDTQYRTAVGRLIARDAKNAQMVITTFRPEIIEVADRFYRVYQKNRVSRIECVAKNEAKRVIDEQTRLEKPDG